MTLPFLTMPCSQTPPESPATIAFAVAYYCLPDIRPCRPPDLPHEAQSLHLRYGLDIALSTLNSCRHLHEPKTRFPGGVARPFPGREFHPLEAPGLAWRTEIRGDINFQDPSRGPSANDSSHFVQRLVLPSSGSEPVRAVEKILLINSIQYFDHRLLHDLVLQGGNRDGSLLPVFLGDIDSAQRLGLILAILEPLMESLDIPRGVPFIFHVRDAVHSRAGFLS